MLYPTVRNRAAWQIAKALGISAKDSLARHEITALSMEPTPATDRSEEV